MSSNADGSACIIKLDPSLEPLREVVRRRGASGEDEMCLVRGAAIDRWNP